MPDWPRQRRGTQWKLMSNIACEGSRMKDFGGVVLVRETTLYLSPFKGVVSTQHSSILGLGPYCGLTVH